MAAIRAPLSDLPKGRPPLRKCPDDFEVIFVEQGRLGCEAWYRARRDTVTRWMRECDAVRAKRKQPTLIAARAAYVAHQRREGKWLTRSSCLVEHREIPRPTIRQSIRDKREVPAVVARHAAQHLRIVRHGGFIVSQAPNGDWRVGTRLLSAAQMLDLARARGFEDKVVILQALQPICEPEVKR